MIWVLDPVAARRALSARLLRCPDCRERLRPWGRARSRLIHDADGREELTPDRARCTGCAATHVLLPATTVPGSGYSARTVTAALLAAADGAGHRRIAAGLAVPAGTVRDWCRRARRGANRIFSHAAQTARLLGVTVRPVDGSAVSPLAEALNAAATVAVALATAWQTPAGPVVPTASGVDYLGRLAAAQLTDLAHRLRLAGIPPRAGTPLLPFWTVVTDGLLPAPPG